MTEIKLNPGNVIQTKEGGKIFEYILYGKIIYEMNFKEIIYISNYNNFSKNLEQFRKDFINLDKKNLTDVFEIESKNNAEISEVYEIYKSLPKDIKDKLEHKKFKIGKIKPNSIFDFETYKFSSGKERKCPIEERRNFFED